MGIFEELKSIGKILIRLINEDDIYFDYPECKK
jgi:hypothetical protein